MDDPALFMGLPLLADVDLGDNRITTLHESLFANNPKLQLGVFRARSAVRVGKNPLNCGAEGCAHDTWDHGWSCIAQFANGSLSGCRCDTAHDKSTPGDVLQRHGGIIACALTEYSPESTPEPPSATTAAGGGVASANNSAACVTLASVATYTNLCADSGGCNAEQVGKYCGPFRRFWSQCDADLRESFVASMAEPARLLDCAFAGLTAFPALPDATRRSVRQLILGDSRTERLTQAQLDAFTAAGFAPTQNRISAFPARGYFQGMGSLVKLRVGQIADDAESLSSIARVPRDTFAGAHALLDLGLTGLRIAQIEAGAFLGLPNLIVLDLSRNRIGNLIPPPEECFAGLSSLAVLDLHSNRIRTLPPRLFVELTSLRVLNLYVPAAGCLQLCCASTVCVCVCMCARVRVSVG